MILNLNFYPTDPLGERIPHTRDPKTGEPLNYKTVAQIIGIFLFNTISKPGTDDNIRAYELGLELAKKGQVTVTLADLDFIQNELKQGKFQNFISVPVKLAIDKLRLDFEEKRKQERENLKQQTAESKNSK